MPEESRREELLREGWLFWQYCEIIRSEEMGSYETKWHLKCPLCESGTIIRYKDDTPGFKESEMTPCGVCGLTGDGSSLRLETASPQFRSAT